MRGVAGDTAPRFSISFGAEFWMSLQTRNKLERAKDVPRYNLLTLVVLLSKP